MSGLAEALDAAVAQVQRYVECSDEQAIAIALWVAYTHAIKPDSPPPFDVVPYLFVSSPEKQSGKTTLLNVIAPMVARPRSIIGTSAAGFVRVLGEQPTLLFDEVDAIFGGGTPTESTEMLRSALNGGFQVGRTSIRYNVRSSKVEDLPVFGPKALFGIGKTVPDTVIDRSIHISLKRRNGVAIQRARLSRVASEGALIASSMAAVIPTVKFRQFADNEFPNELSDRGCDCWEPLLSLAEMAGPVWSTKATAAALVLDAAGRDDLMSEGQELLRDLREVFTTKVANFVPTIDAIGHPEDNGIGATGLCAVEDGPWVSYGRTNRPVTPHRVWKLLRAYGITPHSSGAARGMLKTDFDDVFKRYLTT